MSVRPPRWAERLLSAALSDDPAASAIVGDLLEDFARRARRQGAARARLWYAREATALAATVALRRALSLLLGDRSMSPRPARGLLEDARYALRAVRRNPGFALFAAGVIGLGVGATTSVFSVLRPLVLAPLPLHEPDRLVWISNRSPEGDNSLSAATSRSGNLRDFRRHARVFEGMTGYNAFFQTPYTLSGDGAPERVTGVPVAHDFLDVLGIEVLHGRSFTSEEGLWDGPPAVVLTHGFWMRRFGGDPGMIGRSIVLDGGSRTVVGILPATFDFASLFTPGVAVDVLLPFPVSDETDRWGNTMMFVGRLAPGVTPAAAQQDLDAVVAGLQEEQPDRWGLDAVVTPLQAHIAGPLRPALALLAAAAATVLLIACVNVSNLFLARSPGRAREVAVRKALGASRGRLVRQLLLEAVGIAAIGAALGGALAWGVTRLVAASAAVRIPLLDRIGVDAGALGFAAAVALGTGLLVGLVPALQVADGGEGAVLRSGGRGASASRSARRLREALVVAEVALACVLLVVGGLFVRSFRAVTDVELGFEPEGVVAWQLNPSVRFESNREETDYFSALAERASSVPGVEAVGMIDALPLGKSRSWGFSVVGVPEEDDTDDGIHPHMIDAGYFDVMQIRIVEGRGVSRADTRETPPVVLMNEWGARHVFGDRALGQSIRLWDDREWEVVGIVEDVRHLGLETGPGIQVYFPFTQMGDFAIMELAVRSQEPLEQVGPAVAAALAEMDPTLPTREFWAVESTVDRALSERRFTLGILSGYGLAALFLAGLGIYGVLAQSVAERRPEIGIRMALGASAGEVVRGVLSRTLALTAVGIVVGSLVAMASTGVLRSQLFGVSATDPASFGAMVGILLVVAFAAAAIPAVRAARVRGVRALQSE